MQNKGITLKHKFSVLVLTGQNVHMIYRVTKDFINDTAFLNDRKINR